MQRVLVADDSVAARKSIQQVLEIAGVEVIAVGSGDLALARLESIAPSLVILDVAMPGRSGYEICHELKADSRFAHLPVVLITSDFEPYDEAEARRSGADGHVVKPFDWGAIATLRAIVARLGVDSVREPESLIPAVGDAGGSFASAADGSSTYGVDAYSTVTMPAVTFDTVLPMADAPSGTMVVGFGAYAFPAPEPVAETFTETEAGAASSGEARPLSLPDAVRRAATTDDLAPELADVSSDDAPPDLRLGTRPLGLAGTTCPACAEPLSPGDIFCLACGATVVEESPKHGRVERLSQATSCGQCGQELSSGDVFCIGCGALV